MSDTIWLYWENYPNRQRPVYLDLCLETIQKHCGTDFDVVMLNSSSVEQYLPDIRSDWHKLSQLNQKANYLRYKLLCEYGGIWLDNDVIILRSLKPLMDQVHNTQEYDLMATGSPELKYGEPENGFLVSKKDGKVIKEALRIADVRMDQSVSKQFQWGHLGIQALRVAVKKLPYQHLSHKQMSPISWQASWRFTSAEPIRSICDDNTYGVMLFNEMFKRLKSKIMIMSRKELLETKKLIGQIFRKALA